MSDTTDESSTALRAAFDKARQRFSSGWADRRPANDNTSNERPEFNYPDPRPSFAEPGNGKEPFPSFDPDHHYGETKAAFLARQMPTISTGKSRNRD